MQSRAQLLAADPVLHQEFSAGLTKEENAALGYHWPFWARPEQIQPVGQEWIIWLILAGRGFGKTRSGAEWVREGIKTFRRVNLIAATVDDARDIMIEGESGILSICPTRERPVYKKQDRKLLWPNGATSLIFTADEPDRCRGKQHERVWGDELAAWRYPDAWDQMMLGLRLGRQPRACVTTTPRPTPIIKALIADPTCVMTGGSTYDNIGNIADTFLTTVIRKYKGTRLGQQELFAKILDDNPNALWQREMLNQSRVRKMPEFKRVVVAVDPQAGLDGAETGIITVGLGLDGHGYVIDDCSLRASPNEWGNAAVLAYDKFKADRIIGEENQGGKMVEHVIRSIEPKVSYKGCRAMVGKRLRAEPIAALYEQRKVHHIGTFGTLEDQMCEWTPGDESPDHLDALVWGLTELMLGDVRSRKGYGL